MDCEGFTERVYLMPGIFPTTVKSLIFMPNDQELRSLVALTNREGVILATGIPLFWLFLSDK